MKASKKFLFYILTLSLLQTIVFSFNITAWAEERVIDENVYHSFREGDFFFSGWNDSVSIDAYYGRNTEEITIPAKVRGLEINSISSNALYALKNTLKKLTFAEGSEKVFGNFSYFTALENIEIPDSVKVINGYSFMECLSLKKSFCLTALR